MSRASGRFSRIATLSTAALLIALLLPTTGVSAVVGGSTYHAISPTRLLDTRSANGLTGKFAANTARTFQLTGRGGIPAGATAVTGNLTVTNQSALGYLFIGPVATNTPSSSTLNFPVNDNRANGVTVALSGSGTLSVTYVASAGATTDVLFDVTGYFTADTTGSSYTAISPTRLLDTRSANGLTGKFAANTARTFQLTGRGGIPAGATAVTGNLTVTNQSALGYLFIGPVATNTPSSSTLNFPVNDNRANGVTVALSGSGTLSVTYVASAGATTDVLFDVTGYFTADTTGSSYTAISPTRLLDTRSANGLTGKFAANTARTFQLTGRGGIPAGATAVTGNLTVTNQSALGYLFIGPVATNTPSSSTLNFPVNDNRANGVTVALSGSGTLSVTYVASAGATTDVLFDVTGYFTAIPAAPTVTDVNPTGGTTAGGTSVTITGTNLSSATSVQFGATVAAIVTNTATQIVATSPAHAAGTVDVTVTTGGGTSATSSADHFTYTAPGGTISAVGTLQTDTVDYPALTTTETVSVSPAAVGNVLALAVEEKFPGGTPFTVSTVGGGGVTTWHRSNGGPTTDTQHGQELWWGTVTTAGASTITVTYTSVPGTANSAASLDVQEFHSSIGAATVWAVDANGVVDTGVATTTPNYPALTPTGSHRAYFGYLSVIGSVSAGSTPGVVYQPDLRGNQCAYNVDVSASITPTASSVASQTFFSIGMLLTAS